MLSDPVRRREYDREWGPDVAWCPGGYARRHGDRDDECGGTGQRPKRASTAEDRRSTMASAFTSAFDRGGGNDFEKAVNAWDSMMDQLLQPIKRRGAIRLQKLYRGYIVRKGLGPKFRAFLKRSRKDEKEETPRADDTSIRVGPVPPIEAGKCESSSPAGGQDSPEPPHREFTGEGGLKSNLERDCPVPQTEGQLELSPERKPKTTTVPRRNNSRSSTQRAAAKNCDKNRNKTKKTPPPSPPRKRAKKNTRVEPQEPQLPNQDTQRGEGKEQQSPMHVAMNRASQATIIQRAFKEHMHVKKF